MCRRYCTESKECYDAAYMDKGYVNSITFKQNSIIMACNRLHNRICKILSMVGHGHIMCGRHCVGIVVTSVRLAHNERIAVHNTLLSRLMITINRWPNVFHVWV